MKRATLKGRGAYDRRRVAESQELKSVLVSIYASQAYIRRVIAGDG